MENPLLETEVMVFKMYGIKNLTIAEVESLAFTSEQRKMIRFLMEEAYQKGLKESEKKSTNNKLLKQRGKLNWKLWKR